MQPKENLKRLTENHAAEDAFLLAVLRLYVCDRREPPDALSRSVHARISRHYHVQV